MSFAHFVQATAVLFPYAGGRVVLKYGETASAGWNGPLDRRRRTAYDRLARVYDFVEAPMDWMGGSRRRRRVVARSLGSVLEVGVGTGRNLEHYPSGVRVTAIDLSERMLEQAERRADRLGLKVELVPADVERLPFDDGSFDTVLATCVFCSVRNPVQGLAEVARVVKPGGQVLLLEHVRPRNPSLGRITDLLSPITRALFGPEINRRTEKNVQAAGLELVEVRRAGIWREMIAHPVVR
jgi:ubiquinone/menaquinone biosynthesis C-methylase UbiE